MGQALGVCVAAMAAHQAGWWASSCSIRRRDEDLEKSIQVHRSFESSVCLLMEAGTERTH